MPYPLEDLSDDELRYGLVQVSSKGGINFRSVDEEANRVQWQRIFQAEADRRAGADLFHAPVAPAFMGRFFFRGLRWWNT